METDMTATESVALDPGLSRAETQAAIQTENWKLLQYFNYYRLLIALSATIIAVVGNVPPFGSASPELFRYGAFIYIAIGMIAQYTIYRRSPNFDTQANILAFLDVALIAVLMHSSGGISSGLVLLLLVAIAGISLMVDKRDTIFYAALATIGTLLEHSWPLFTGQTVNMEELSQGYPQIGILGVGMFVTAFIGYTLATRLRATEALAEKRGVDLASLTHVNELVIARMQSGVLVCDADGAIRLVNQAAQRFLGAKPVNGKRQTLSDVSPDLAIQLFQWANNTPSQQARKLLTTRAGYTLMPRFAAIGEDRQSGALVFLDDMSILKRQTQQLKMEALARLTASIAHEIRNPLGAITNAAQLLGETVKPANTEEQRLVTIIEEQSKRMNVIVQNVTQLSRRDKVNPVKLSLETWIEEFIRQYGESTGVPKEAFTCVGLSSMLVCVDADQLYQVVGNLCQNSLRASPQFSGTPLIKFQGSKDADGHPALDVIDWGHGVKPEILDHIFDPFFTTTAKGTGLGLYIARELCEGNGGSLSYHSGEGGVGSRFRVTFMRAEDCAQLEST
jgi:two-component system, NtrC family, sensor histidine kinase PilS